MARHIVKCKYCGVSFDTELNPYVKVNQTRYAHKTCHEQNQAKIEKTKADEIALRNYIKELFGYTKIPDKIEYQIKSYINDKNYTYSGILKTLKYFFEVKKNPIEKANGGIGIVPWCYQQAREYWFNLWAARDKNEELTEKMKNETIISVKEIHIRSPQRQPMKHAKKLFTFLDEKEDNCD